jgi:hypothetical protein
MSEAMETVRRAASALRGASSVRIIEPAATPANAPTAAGASRPNLTCVSANTEMKGSIVTTDNVDIAGKVEGDVRAASITVSANGKVKGDLIAEVIMVYGDVEGRLQAQDVRLCAGANVTGENRPWFARHRYRREFRRHHQTHFRRRQVS